MLASQHIRDGMVIMLDGSTSAYHLVPYLSRFKDIIVITSGAKTAVALAELQIPVYCTGGRMRTNSFSYVGREAEEMVERLVSATSQNRQTEIAIENVARHLNESQQQVMQIRADILTATEAVYTFRVQVDTIREENKKLKASNDLLAQRLNKAAALFADLNTKVANLLQTQEHRYPVPTDTTHQANEPDVYPNK